MQAAARMLIESYRYMLDRGQVSKRKALEQDIAEWVYTCIVPDNAHRTCCITHSDTWEILQRGATIAGNSRRKHGDDSDGIAGH